MNIKQIITSELENKKKEFIVGVSGGIDSMVLLDVLVKHKEYKIVVCHVNYNLRKDSKKDSQIIEKFCDENNILFYKKNILDEIKGNIQGQARLIRYKFFKEISNEINISQILVGHHSGDNIETFLLQKQRDIVVEHYGLKKTRTIANLEILRPMLSINKDAIKRYATINNVIWREDPSNAENKYKRNIIRHNIVDNAGWIKIFFLLTYIKILNRKQKKLFSKVFKIKDKYIDDNKIDSTLFEEKESIIKIILYWYLKTNKYPVNRINKKIILEIINFHSKTIKIQANIDLAKEFKWKKDYNKYYITKGGK